MRHRLESAAKLCFTCAVRGLVPCVVLIALCGPTALILTKGVSAARVPIAERVAHGKLAGLPAAGRVLVFKTANATVAALDSDDPVAELAAYRREGLVGSALQRFGNGQTTFGMSLTLQLSSPAYARAEAARNVASIRRDAAHPRKGTTGRAVAFSQIPGATAFEEHFKDAGTAIEFAGVVFSGGPFCYFVQSGGPDESLDERAVYRAAVALYQRVAGR